MRFLVGFTGCILLFGNGFSGEVERYWTLRDGRTSKLLVSHIDGAFLYLQIPGKADRLIDMNLLSQTDHIFAIKHCDFRPLPEPDMVTVDGAPVYRATSTWREWILVFSKHSSDGLLGQDASEFRNRIMQFANNSAELNRIKLELLEYRPGKEKALATTPVKTAPSALDTGELIDPETVRESLSHYRPYGTGSSSGADAANTALNQMKANRAANGPTFKNTQNSAQRMNRRYFYYNKY